MKPLCHVCEVEVSFSLPEWFPPDRFDYRKIVKFPVGHKFEGQTDHSIANEHHNSAEDAIFRLKGVSELCSHSWGPWVSVKFPDGKNFDQRVIKFKAKLERFLRRYKESNECST